MIAWHREVSSERGFWGGLGDVSDECVVLGTSSLWWASPKVVPLR